MKLLMMGTGPFAVPTFEALLADGHDIPLLVTRPPVMAKGKTPPPNPMREVAIRHAVPVFDPPNVNDLQVVGRLRELEPDLLVVCDYGQILSTDVLAVAKKGGINLHGSLLPKYRGAAPVQWCVYHGDRESGVSVIHLTPRLDGGPVLAQVRTAVDEQENAGQLEARLSLLGVETVRQAIAQVEAWDGQSPLGVVQDPAQVTKAPRLHKAQGHIDWSRGCRELRNQVRAFQPWPGSFAIWERSLGEPLRLIVIDVEPVRAEEQPEASEFLARLDEYQPGQVVKSDRKVAWVRTGDGLLSLRKIQPAGKRVMEIDEFLRGYPLLEGQLLR